MTDEEQHIATLVYPDEYAKNVSQIASLSTHKLVYVKRKELSLKPFDLLEFHTSLCTCITYEIKWAFGSMIFGAFLVALVFFVLSSDLTAAPRVPIGALAIVLVFGGILARGPKRHRLTFLVDGKPMRWQSKAGDFKYKVIAVERVIAYARDAGIFRETGLQAVRFRN
jgi:hypothetical protein